MKFFHNLENIEEKRKIFDFLEEKYNEFVIMKKVYDQTFRTAKPLGFQIIFLKMQNIIVTEFMMENVEENLTEILLKDKNSDLKLKIFFALCYSLYDLDQICIFHGDIKKSNVLIKYEE